jgi:hypothetical protein
VILYTLRDFRCLALKFGGILDCFEGDLPLKGLLRLKENLPLFLS